MVEKRFIVAGKCETMIPYIRRLEKELHLHVEIDYVLGRIKRYCLFEIVDSDKRPIINLKKLEE